MSGAFTKAWDCHSIPAVKMKEAKEKGNKKKITQMGMKTVNSAYSHVWFLSVSTDQGEINDSANSYLACVLGC